ncbi:MAG: biotin/lipoyl-binding protein, partial [Candidatus Komeilibacteria bacterium]|nr:biotin/lipoyl-binding protein [Candidatus Komeilibacteria bacterium]
MSKKRKIYIISALALASLFIIYGLISAAKSDPMPYDFVAASRKNITSEVDVTGHVRPAENVDLAFERGGRVASVLSSVGDKVAGGQILLTLNSREIQAELARSRANVDSARASLQQYEAAVSREEANLEALVRGAKSEEIALSETKVASAERALQDARANVEQTTNKVAIDLVNVYEGIKDVLRDAYAKADDAINRQTEAIFINETTSPQLSFNIIDPQLKTEIEWQRSLINKELDDLRSLLLKQSLSLSSLENDLDSGRKHLLSIRDFLQRTNEVI